MCEDNEWDERVWPLRSTHLRNKKGAGGRAGGRNHNSRPTVSSLGPSIGSGQCHAVCSCACSAALHAQLCTSSTRYECTSNIKHEVLDRDHLFTPSFSPSTSQDEHVKSYITSEMPISHADRVHDYQTVMSHGW